MEPDCQLCGKNLSACECMDKARDRIKQGKCDAALEAVGWAYADCCTDLDAGKDPRKADMDDVIARAKKDLDL